MIIAAKEDKHAHKEGLPAFSKIRMLDRVMDTLQKLVFLATLDNLLRLPLGANMQLRSWIRIC